MSTQLSPDVTMGATAISASHRPALCAVRRAVIRLQAARTTREMLRELVAVPQPSAVRGTPRFVRLDRLSERYAALGGDPTDLLR
jgi:hypothetical protein